MEPRTEIRPPPWDLWETIVRRDPGGRGVASYRHNGEPLGYGDLERAATELAERGRRVAIVTGFCIADADPPAAETDGPPGALFLARALAATGSSALLVSDAFGAPLLEAGAALWNLSPPSCEIVAMPASGGANGEFDAWVDALFDRECPRGLTHVVAIERAGPSHTFDSVGEREGLPNAERFAAETPPKHRDAHHNMRGAIIDRYTPPAHRIFERIAERNLAIATIGIGDGGNEIGMGRFPWSLLREAIRVGPAAHTACRIATDYTIVAGVSNWGAYALALGVAAVRGRRNLAAAWTTEDQARLIACTVAAGGVDGVSKRREASVDGIALDDYLAVLDELRQSLRD
ncbi:MAG: glutamate cyclase domain-containing protein [Pirellulales bacterium]